MIHGQGNRLANKAISRGKSRSGIRTAAPIEKLSARYLNLSKYQESMAPSQTYHSKLKPARSLDGVETSRNEYGIILFWLGIILAGRCGRLAGSRGASSCRFV